MSGEHQAVSGGHQAVSGWTAGGTRLCLVGVRRTAQMNGFHLNCRVKFMLYKVEIHLDELWFVHVVLLKQIRIVPEVAVVF